MKTSCQQFATAPVLQEQLVSRIVKPPMIWKVWVLLNIGEELLESAPRSRHYFYMQHATEKTQLP
jgi:hypothetical protein